jgi:integrase/recombinase XerD
MPILALPVQTIREIEFMPYVYSHAELAALFAAVSMKKHGTLIEPTTLRVFLLTLYATGGSVNEILRMRTSQVDLDQSQVTLNGSQRTRKRSIPICSDLRIELKRYLEVRELNNRNDIALFQTFSGDELKAGYLSVCFQRLLQIAGVARRDQFKRPPRMQDLRATFAVHRLSSWLKDGSDLNRLVPALSFC